MLIIAHRGAHGAPGTYEENTRDAFQAALEMDADAVETDLRKCQFVDKNGKKCEQIVLSHDPIDNLEKHKNSMTLKDFLSADFAEWMELHLEIKEKDIINEICALTSTVRFKDHIIYSSFKWLELLKLRRKYKRARIGMLWDQVKVKLPNWLVALFANILGAESIHLQFNELTKETVKYFRGKGFLVYAYTVNTEEEIDRARKLDLDGIFTDYPSRAYDVLSRPIQ